MPEDHHREYKACIKLNKGEEVWVMSMVNTQFSK
jgi:hypothetical protein